MGILYYGHDLLAPSHLWMRRMLDGLGDEVSVLATQVDPTTVYAGDATVMLLDAGPYSPHLWRRAVQSETDQWRNVRRLKAAMARPDVTCALVHFLTHAVKFQAVWRHTSKRVFVHCHGIDVTWQKRAARHSGWRRWVYRNYLTKVMRLPGNVHFIANSNATRQKLLDVGIAEERIVVKYLGVPVPAAPPERQTRGDDVRLLYLGRLFDAKGPDLTIRAFDLACEQGLQGELTVAGDGPLAEQCKQLRDRSRYADRIKLVGAVDADKGERLRQEADIFTAHSQRGPTSHQEEAFGVAFVEAMAAGLPVVTGRSGSLPEVVRDGIDGILFEPGDIAAHAQALLSLARREADRRRMGAQAWRHAADEFSIARENAQLREICLSAKPAHDAS